MVNMKTCRLHFALFLPICVWVFGLFSGNCTFYIHVKNSNTSWQCVVDVCVWVTYSICLHVPVLVRMVSRGPSGSFSSLTGRSKECQKLGRDSSTSLAKCIKLKSNLDKMDQLLSTAGNCVFVCEWVSKLHFCFFLMQRLTLFHLFKRHK